MSTVAPNTRPFGMDYGRYDGLLDFPRLAMHREQALFLAFRCTISWGYQDPFFMANFREAGNRGYCRMAYHVVYSNEDPTRQMDNLFRAVAGAWTEYDRFVLDDELEVGAHQSSIFRRTNTLRSMRDIIKARTGHFPAYYSRAEFINRNVDYRGISDMPLWLAQYMILPKGLTYAPEHPGPPTLPRGANKWLIHQTGDKLPNICGTAIGDSPVKMYQDYDRFNGTPEDVYRFFGRAKPVVEQPPQEHHVYLPIVANRAAPYTPEELSDKVDQLTARIAALEAKG